MTDDIDLRPIQLTTSDGLTLEGQIAIPSSPVAAAVLAHPHPLFGGNMTSLVTGELFRELPRRDVVAVRFNFRGVDGSEGEHDKGVDEAHDIVAAIDAAAEALGPDAAGRPIVMAGWSFGADVSLRVDDPRLAGWCAIAPPLRVVDPADMKAPTDPRPKLLLIPEHDEFNPPERARPLVADWTATELAVIGGADHYLVGRTDRVADACREMIDTLVNP